MVFYVTLEAFENYNVLIFLHFSKVVELFYIPLMLDIFFIMIRCYLKFFKNDLKVKNINGNMKVLML